MGRSPVAFEATVYAIPPRSRTFIVLLTEKADDPTRNLLHTCHETAVVRVQVYLLEVEAVQHGAVPSLVPLPVVPRSRDHTTSLSRRYYPRLF